MRTSIARLIAVLTTVLLPVVLLPAPADAAVVTIVSRSGATAGTPPVEMTSFECGELPFQSGSTGTYAVDRAIGPGTPPLGTGSLRINQLQAGLISGVSIENRSLDALASFSGRFRSNLATRVYGAIRVTADDGSVWLGTAAVANLTANTWQMANGLAAHYDWLEQYPGDRFHLDMTPGDFRGAHGWGTTSAYLAAGTCNGFTASTVYVDNFRVNRSGGDTQVFDFEPRLATNTSMSATRSTITSGGSTTLSTTLRHNSKVLPGRTMFLLAKKYGDAGYTQVGTGVTTNSNGVARKTVSPATNTTYQWYFKGDRNYRPVASPFRSIGVMAKVTLTLFDSTLRPGQTLVATGRISPAKVDKVATLWRKTASGPVKLGSVTLTQTDGTYQITRTLSARGTYKVFVTVPAATGNLKGTSPVRTATVS
jgi:hypothetical protein